MEVKSRYYFRWTYLVANSLAKMKTSLVPLNKLKSRLSKTMIPTVIGRSWMKMNKFPLFKNLPWQPYHGLIVYLFIVHFSVCNGHKILNRTRYDEHINSQNNLINKRVVGNSSSVRLVYNNSIITSAKTVNTSKLSNNQQNYTEHESMHSDEKLDFANFFLRNASDHDFRSEKEAASAHSRVERGTIEAWMTTNVGQPLKSVKARLLSLLDNYVPRSVILKLANLISSYHEGKSNKTLNWSLSEKKYLLATVENLGIKLDEIAAKNVYTVVQEISGSLPESPTLMKKSFDFLTSNLLARLEKKNRDVTARQTPFGIVNFFLGVLADPIILGLFIALNIWIIFWGVYTFAFGAGFAFLPGFFGGGPGLFGLLGFGGGDGGGGGSSDPPAPDPAPIVISNIVIATESPPSASVDISIELESTNVSSTECPCESEIVVEPPDDPTSTALPDPPGSPPGYEPDYNTTDQIGILLNFPFLQACLSLGGSKVECVKKAYLYAQILQGPFNISMIEELFGGSQGSYGRPPGAYGGSIGSYTGSSSSYGSSPGSYDGSSGSYDGTTGSHESSYGSQEGSFVGSQSSFGSYVKPQPTAENPLYKPSKTTPDPINLFGELVFPPHFTSPAPPPFPSLITFIPPPIDSEESVRPLPPLIVGGTTSQTGLITHYPMKTKQPSFKPYPYHTTSQPDLVTYSPQTTKPPSFMPYPYHTTAQTGLNMHHFQHTKSPSFKPYPYHTTPPSFKPYTSSSVSHYTSHKPYPAVHKPYPTTANPLITFSYPYSIPLKPYQTSFKPDQSSQSQPYPPSFKPYHTSVKPEFSPYPPPASNIGGSSTPTNQGKPSLSELIMALHPHAVIVPVNSNQIDSHWKEKFKKK